MEWCRTGLVAAIKEASSTFLGIKYEFPFRGEFQLLPDYGCHVPWGDASRVPEDSTDHRSGVEHDLVSDLELITNPQRARFQILIVIARSKVKTLLVCAERRGGAGTGRVARYTPRD